MCPGVGAARLLGGADRKQTSRSGGYTRTSGSVSLDPSLPITNLEARINTVSLGYSRTFDLFLFGETASAAILPPFVEGDLSGDVESQGGKVLVGSLLSASSGYVVTRC